MWTLDFSEPQQRPQISSGLLLLAVEYRPIGILIERPNRIKTLNLIVRVNSLVTASPRKYLSTSANRSYGRPGAT